MEIDKETKTTLTKITYLVFSCAKSFWDATVQIMWGMVTFFLLAALIEYYNIDASILQGLFMMVKTLIANWQIVWGVLFIFYFLINHKEINK